MTKLFGATFAIVAAPIVLTRSISVLDYARAYGWSSDEAFMRGDVLLFAASILTSAGADAVDPMIRWHRRGRRISQPPSTP